MPTVRYFRPTKTDADQVGQCRETIRKARELLDQPLPDTFLGRRRHMPLAELKADDEPDVA